MAMFYYFLHEERNVQRNYRIFWNYTSMQKKHQYALKFFQYIKFKFVLLCPVFADSITFLPVKLHPFSKHFMSWFSSMGFDFNFKNLLWKNKGCSPKNAWLVLIQSEKMEVTVCNKLRHWVCTKLFTSNSVFWVEKVWWNLFIYFSVSEQEILCGKPYWNST